MKTLSFTLFFLGLSSLEAQQQLGSVAIAGAITPSMETATVSEFTGCVEKLTAAKVVGKEAVKACTKIAEIAAKTTTRLANEAADATKASRPIIMMGRGYGNYRTGGGYSSSYRRPVVKRSPPPRRPARPTTPSK